MAMACNSMSRKHLKTSAHKELQSAHKVPGWIGCGRNKQRKVVQLCLRTLSRLRAATLPSKSEQWKGPMFPLFSSILLTHWIPLTHWPCDELNPESIPVAQWLFFLVTARQNNLITLDRKRLTQTCLPDLKWLPILVLLLCSSWYWCFKDSVSLPKKGTIFRVNDSFSSSQKQQYTNQDNQSVFEAGGPFHQDWEYFRRRLPNTKHELALNIVWS